MSGNSDDEDTMQAHSLHTRNQTHNGLGEHAEKGISSLRSSSAYGAVCEKPVVYVDEHAKKGYDWLDVKKSSRIRGIASWQACGGVSFCAAVHHRGMQRFRYYGNSLHSSFRKPPRLETLPK